MLKALTGLGAAGAMLVTGMAPAIAAPAPRGTFDAAPIGAPGWNPADESASQWRGGWGDRRWRGRNRGVDAGDILAGVLILGGIAAVASAATNSARRGDDRSFNDDVRSASDRCGAAAVAQSGLGSRIERIDNVVRDGQGWRVEGLVGSRRNGVDSFTCGISFGRIDYVRFNRANGAWGANDGAFDNGVAVADPPFSVDPNDDDYAWRNDDADAEPFPPE
ncbi:MAG: hypothetical protein Q27BB25_05290 [Blastomonas sp. CACIA14H2]|uniref:hypothetical protein n=1 Tax=Blastomonas sp. CACIA14H2 TaxID=1419876 RepID=UPI0003D05ACA|nr:MAG: hypothetical protein Q27BB25_05290 [Blastomonas sp. CACIA14H2]